MLSWNSATRRHRCSDDPAWRIGEASLSNRGTSSRLWTHVSAKGLAVSKGRASRPLTRSANLKADSRLPTQSRTLAPDGSPTWSGKAAVGSAASARQISLRRSRSYPPNTIRYSNMPTATPIAIPTVNCLLFRLSNFFPPQSAVIGTYSLCKIRCCHQGSSSTGGTC